jgi:hypothetical protein
MDGDYIRDTILGIFITIGFVIIAVNIKACGEVDLFTSKGYVQSLEGEKIIWIKPKTNR